MVTAGERIRKLNEAWRVHSEAIMDKRETRRAIHGFEKNNELMSDNTSEGGIGVQVKRGLGKGKVFLNDLPPGAMERVMPASEGWACPRCGTKYKKYVLACEMRSCIKKGVKSPLGLLDWRR